MKVAYYLMVFAVSILVTNGAIGENLIFNGDFEQGDTGFNTDYTYSPTGFPEGTYAINTDPYNLAPLWASYNDHTTGAGNMMIVNGATSPDVVVWEQTISLSPNTNYAFSFWLSKANEGEGGDPSELEYFINNVSLGVMNTPEQRGIWVQDSKPWYSGTDTVATIKMVDRNTSWWANDFALDDISFETVPEPGTVCLLGLGVLGLVRRKR
ncbi:MAG: PEP-CTERM sorting domain-containing protein [Sedimentisphaerales bacterium]|nr:PEP-CTERM sorting domain-containing protein [Sedimentisphaerales bacterium]